MDLSIIVPTMNRPNFVARLVRYYAAIKFTGSVIIGDGSKEVGFAQIKALTSEFSDALNIRHLHMPGCSVDEAVRRANEVLDTKYACLLGDDDFIVPGCAAKCIDFLESNGDYVAAHGAGILLSSLAGDPSRINNLSRYDQPQLTGDTASARISAHLSSYRVGLFSVHRKETWLRMFDDGTLERRSEVCEDKTFAAELLPCCLSVAAGKIAHIEGLYLVRQTHNHRYLLPSWLSWVSGENWSASYLYFRKKLSEVIMDSDGLDEGSASKVVDDAFSSYFETYLCRSSGQLAMDFRSYLSKFLSIKSLVRGLRKLSSLTDNRLDLQKILNSSSPYYEDFVPIYNAVRSTRTENKNDF